MKDLINRHGFVLPKHTLFGSIRFSVTVCLFCQYLFQLKLQVPVTSLLLSIRRMNSIFVTAFYIYFRIICKICLASFDIKNSLSPKDSGSFISLYVRKSSLCRNRHHPVDLLPYKPEADHLHDDRCNPGYRIRQKQESQ